MKRKRTEVEIEIDEVIHVAFRRHDWCAACRSETQLITPEQAAVLARVTVRAVNQRVEAGEIHFLETEDGRLWVCAKSLL